MALAASGIGSGLDVNSIVQQLMQIEQRPISLLNQREAGFQAQLSTLGLLKGAISNLQGAAQALAEFDTVTYRATVSDTGILSATAGTTAHGAVHSVDVANLAQGQKLVAAGQATRNTAIGSGGATTVTITAGAITGGTLANGRYTGATFTPDPDGSPVTLTIDASNNTLEGIRDAINASGAGITASIINDGTATPYRLALSTDGSGADSSLRIDVAGDAALAGLLAQDPAGTQNLAETQSARDAAFTVDGIAITRPGNVVSDVIDGVTLTLKAESAAPVTVTVARDTGSAQTALQNFVKAYNDLNKSIGDATGKGRQLQGDAGVLGFQQRVRNAVGSFYGSTSSAYRSLSALGLTFQLDGTLAFDSTKLAAALDADSAGALATITGAGSAAQAQADAALGTGGLIDAGTNRLNDSIRTLDERRTHLQNRLIDVEARYRAQYTALDVMLSSMSQTSQFLQTQLAQLPSPAN